MASQGSILVTGTNGGLGSAIVAHITGDASLAKTYHGLYTVRNPQRASTVEKILEGAAPAGHKYDLVPLDLSSLASARKTAEDINRKVAAGSIPPIRALILNAGWQEYTTHTLTDDGFDMSFQANFLSHFLLTLLLLKSMDKDKGRIVVLGSWSHDHNAREMREKKAEENVPSTTDKRNKMGPSGGAYGSERYNQIFKQPLNTEGLARGKWSSADEHPKDLEAGFRRYGASKLCEVMMMRELSRRIAQDPKLSRIAVLAVDPGAMASSLGERGPFMIKAAFKMMSLLNPIMAYLSPNGDLRTTTKSASDVVNAAFETGQPYGERPNGMYMDGSAAGEVGPEARDGEKCRKLWEDSLGYAGIKEGDTVLAGWRSWPINAAKLRELPELALRAGGVLAAAVVALLCRIGHIALPGRAWCAPTESAIASQELLVSLLSPASGYPSSAQNILHLSTEIRRGQYSADTLSGGSPSP